MGYLQLQPHVSFAIVDRRPVFLDLRRDRYLALDPAAESAFHRARHGDGELAGDDPAADQLLGTRLFSLAEEPQRLQSAQAEVPPCSADVASASRRPLDVLEIWLLLSGIRRALAREPLAKVVAKVRQRGLRPATAKDDQDIAALAARFQRARALLPIRPSCLQDSLALSDWLARRSAFPSIIFGVKLDPFAAHCWVQTDSAILNDAADVVAEFTPILVIR